MVCRCSFSSIRFSEADWILVSRLYSSILYSFYYHVKCYSLKLLTSSNAMTHLIVFKSPCPSIYQLVSSRTAGIAEDIPLFSFKKSICYFFIHVAFYFWFLSLFRQSNYQYLGFYLCILSKSIVIHLQAMWVE